MDLQDCLKALSGGDYARLDAHFNRLQRDFESGRISDTELQDALCIDDIRRVDLLPRFLEWVERYPGSYAAHAAAAASLVGVAWEARQAAPSGETVTRRFELMSGYLAKAVPLLGKALALSPLPCLALPNGIRIQASGALDAGRGYLGEARALAGRSALLCRQILWALNPKWSGDETAFHAFYQEMASQNWSEPQRRLLDAAYHVELGDIARCQENDLGKALALCRKAAEICPRSFTRGALGDMAEYCGEAREAQASYLQALAFAPDPGTYFALGRLRQYHLNDRPGAAEAYEKAAVYGHGEAATRWAELHLTYQQRDRREDPALSDKIDYMLNMGMRQYSSTAWFYQAGRHMNGEGVPKNEGQAISCWTEAAGLGCGMSSMNLGLSYWDGLHGVKRDYGKAFHYMQTAVELGQEDAFGSLGRMYYRGHGTKQDYAAARRYLEIAAERDHRGALADMARIHWLGHGVPEDRRTAKAFLERLKAVDPGSYEEVHAELASWTGALSRGLGGLWKK